MTSDQLASLKSTLRISEGVTYWPYRDSGTQGNATVGVGHLIQDFEAAQALPFQPAITKQDWDNLMSAPRALKATAYQIDTKCRLSDETVDTILDADVQLLIGLLTVKFTAFDSFPGSAQQALTDMAFNLGVNGLMKFTKLVAAVKVGDWKACASQCHRVGISDARNLATAKLFMGAA